MNTYIGADLGTSALKLSLVDTSLRILNKISIEYPIFQDGVSSEQNPTDWWNALNNGIEKLLVNQNRKLVKGISFSGQMHGLVILDKNDNVIRPCMLWNDGRSEKETKYLNEEIGKDNLSNLVGNIAYAGFTAPKLLWVKNNEPDNFKKIQKIMLPKDYLAYRLTGNLTTDYSDASGTLYLDVKNKCWSKEMLKILGISEDFLPKLHESTDCIGEISSEFKKAHKLDNVKVYIGAGDNAAASVGMGVINEGEINISLGTSGTVFIPTDEFVLPKNNSLHSFANVNGKYHLMGCILSAASNRKWWLENILDTSDYQQDEIEMSNADSDKLYFLPYLSGERSPHNDTNIRGAFIGLSHSTSKADMSKAILEGVAFALRDCLEIAKENGYVFTSARICGGGSKSKIWNQLFSDILNLKVYKSDGSPSLGAAIIAMVGNKEFKNLKEATSNLSYQEEYKPNKKQVDIYQRKYEVFKELYPALKDIYK